MKNAIDKYLRYLKVERNASLHTIRSYKIDVNQFYTFCQAHFEEDDPNIEFIERITIRLWLGELSENDLAKSSITRKVAAVRSFFKYCFKRGYVQKNPAHLLVVPKKDRPLPKTASREDIERMLNQVEGDSPRIRQSRAILEVFYSTGIRLSELTNLNESDINFKLRQIKVLGKGSKQRIVPIGDTALKALKKHLATKAELYGNRTDSDARNAVFLAANGQRIYAKAVQRMVKKYLQKVSEVTQKSPHVLRHSFATHLLDKGADIRVIKELLGHNNLSATQVYTHTSVERLKNIYELAHPRAKT